MRNIYEDGKKWEDSQLLGGDATGNKDRTGVQITSNCNFGDLSNKVTIKEKTSSGSHEVDSNMQIDDHNIKRKIFLMEEDEEQGMVENLSPKKHKASDHVDFEPH
ncbi:hypothetical protein ACH5RR_037992 [Cinchona calisaya]|uniref:Uncharacterized protein n=1 Tax=Cinchona calisaya TaxID=153742 RepID=A0ABD2Y942_9GENT